MMRDRAIALKVRSSVSVMNEQGNILTAQAISARAHDFSARERQWWIQGDNAH